MLADRIRQKLADGLTPRHLDVINESDLHAGHRSSPGTGESHFRVIVVADAFTGETRLARHRQINALLAEELSTGGVHALAIQAYAPDEQTDAPAPNAE
ncbi:MAG: BolA family protein [Pseudomonadota bacterium]